MRVTKTGEYRKGFEEGVRLERKRKQLEIDDIIKEIEIIIDNGTEDSKYYDTALNILRRLR